MSPTQGKVDVGCSVNFCVNIYIYIYNEFRDLVSISLLVTEVGMRNQRLEN